MLALTAAPLIVVFTVPAGVRDALSEVTFVPVNVCP